MFLVFTLFLGCLIGVSSSRCPQNSVPTFTNEKLCYFWSKPNNVYRSLVAYVTYLGAEIECKKKGGHLASIPNLKENQYLRELVKTSASDVYWIGLNRFGGSESWIWEDNSTISSFSNWENNETRAYGEGPMTKGKHCGAFIEGTGKWDARDCLLEKLYICLIPAMESTSDSTTTTSSYQ